MRCRFFYSERVYYSIHIDYKQIIISNCIKCHKKLNKHSSTLESNPDSLLLLIYMIYEHIILYRMKDCHSSRYRYTEKTHKNGKHHGPHCRYIIYHASLYYHNIVVEGSRLHCTVACIR